MRVSVYSHPLCVLPEDIRRFSVKSISDWKNEYFEECKGCSAVEACGGFFSSHSLRRSAHIHSL
jgi:radical SAM protein with 4Fe4S-binding SPASM domain